MLRLAACAIAGLPEEPFADFLAWAEAPAPTAPPEHFFAPSRGATSATAIDLLPFVALVTAYLSSLVDRRKSERPPEVE